MSPATLTDRVVSFTAADGTPGNLINVRGARESTKGPVLLVHGAGVRANMFRPPTGRTLVQALVDEGYDVWLENWRASIDLAPHHWTLDQAAVFDHPRAVAKVTEETGSDELKAVIHCQGSTSFMMSAVAGLVPEVKTIVANAVSLHPIVPRLAKTKLRFMIPPAARVFGYLDPQWGNTGAPWLFPKLLYAYVMATHRECDNAVCRLASYTYGVGEPTLWRHENLDDATHDWIRQEFAKVPLTFFAQMTRSVEAGELVPVDHRPELPESFLAQPPRTDARFAFLAGEQNNCFVPESQEATQRWFDQREPGRHSLHVFPGYGHLDVFIGRRASEETFPTIIDELEAE